MAIALKQIYEFLFKGFCLICFYFFGPPFWEKGRIFVPFKTKTIYGSAKTRHSQRHTRLFIF